MRKFVEPEMKVMAVNMRENIANSVQWNTIPVKTSGNSTFRVYLGADQAGNEAIVDTYPYANFNQNKSYKRTDFPSNCLVP